MMNDRDGTCDGRLNRRTLLKAAAGLAGGVWASAWAGQATAAQRAGKIRIGSCRIGLTDARKAGLDGVEVRVGGPADTLEIADPSVRQKYKDEMKETGLVISSFMMGLLNSNPLASDPRGPAWLQQSIDAAADLGAGVILVAFFGQGSLLDENGQLKQADVDVVVERIKAAAPRAKQAGVILALENTLSAQQNIEILERIGHESVAVYYDVGNSTRMGYDVPAEIRLLKSRIAMLHFKDGPNYLGEGVVKFDPIAAAIRDIGYQGWIVMETSNPSKDGVADAKRNAAYIRKLPGMAP
ncbi:MAG: TIM barrel protein [Candidatus Anammoximicrobium sp.]|nr:TIM barrel protein [Candidatus Anammoximicrobium sp.]